MNSTIAGIPYDNPAFRGGFPDPFMFHHDGTYYAVATGKWFEADGEQVFPIIKSEDLAHWEWSGQALVRPDESLGTDFWAPEIAFHDGLFYLYYSVGFGDKKHHLRVATSDGPAGPYEDIGEPLMSLEKCPFSIDAHPFLDIDGQWYLFYARDFLDSEDGMRPGTGLVVDRLVDMTSLAGEETTVLRARYDWQCFLRDREMYGQRYHWHTLEGPFVVGREGLYYCFFSGGNWQNATYGVDYAIARGVRGPYRSESPDGARVLRTQPGGLTGPGHNSICRGIDGARDYIVYHAWNDKRTQRQLHIDELAWTELGPRIKK